ncbi:AroM family protein [Scopulibacillus cellulosilyticus]|uniref:AroM family protein n=1 Tax=Scopulibacillus cellulosilyticus TaxID=2665665 RepID=A0ABW2Q2D8_9BACL
MKQKVGLLTIGQSPRVDMTPEMKMFLGEQIELVEMGAIDGMSGEELKELAPVPGDLTYVSRLKDGGSIKLSKQALLPKLQDKIKQLEAAGVSSTILACTGSFPPFQHEKPLLFPDKVLASVVQAVLQKGTLGIIMPLAEQLDLTKEKWGGSGLDIKFASASPYEPADFSEAAKELREQQADLIVLDCMGYTFDHQSLVRKVSGVPVILSRSIVAKVAGELAAG